MDNFSRQELLCHMGFSRDPFKAADFETGDSLRVQSNLKMAIQDNEMFCIVGARGIGKTRAIFRGLEKLNATVAPVLPLDKERLLISDIEQEIILELSDEKPKRGKGVRLRQLRRILGEATMNKRVVVVIEEAHALNRMTLRALKRLRELSWMGKSELFALILIGQSDPMQKAGVSEVRLRSDSLHMQGLMRDEVDGYIRDTVGQVFEEGAIKAIAQLPECRNYLDLQHLLVRLMGQALAEGRKTVTAEDVREVLGIKTRKMPVKKQPEEKPKNGSKALKDVLGRHTGTEGNAPVEVRATG